MPADVYLDAAAATPPAARGRRGDARRRSRGRRPDVHPPGRPRRARAARGRRAHVVVGARRAARRDRLHVRRHRVGRARDLGRGARAARARDADRRLLGRAPGGGRRRQRPRERRVRGRDRAGRRAPGAWTWTGSPRRCAHRGTLLASVQHANHEIGTIQQIGEAARLCREAGVRFHTDACQTVGRLPVDVPRARRRPALAVRRTSSAGRPGWARSTSGAGWGSPPTRAATTASASGARGWRTRPGSPGWLPRSTPRVAHDGRRGGADVVRDRRPPRASRRGARRHGVGPPHAPRAPPRVLQPRRARPRDLRDGARRPGVRGRRRVALHRPARGSLPRARAARCGGHVGVPGQHGRGDHRRGAAPVRGDRPRARRRPAPRGADRPRSRWPGSSPPEP